MKKNSLLFLVLFSIVFHYCEAQSTKIKGKIVNESNEPMPLSILNSETQMLEPLPILTENIL